jgi:hypothetical protein
MGRNWIVIVCPARPAHKAVVFQPDAGVYLAVELDDVTRCPKAFS